MQFKLLSAQKKVHIKWHGIIALLLLSIFITGCGRINISGTIAYDRESNSQRNISHLSGETV
jgi:hypothetical protein